MGTRFFAVKSSGLGVNQTKVIAGSAYVGSCALSCDLVAALLGVDSYEPTVAELLSLHEAVTGTSHDFENLCQLHPKSSSCFRVRDSGQATRS